MTSCWQRSIGDAIARVWAGSASGSAKPKLSDDAVGYLEFHIEQGPVLESLGLPLGVVEAIVGQSRVAA